MTKNNTSMETRNAPATLSRHSFYGLKLDEYQRAFRDAIWDKDKLIVFCNAKAGTGKAQPKDTLIPTPNGLRYLGDIRSGDFVFGRDGKPTKVLGVYEQGMQEAYRVSFNDGRSTICAGEHLWTYFNPNKKGQMVTETLNSMLGRSIICGSSGARYNIPINSVVEYSTKEYTVDPYVVGVFLGDGCCTCEHLALSSNDEELVAEVATLIGCEYRKCSDKNYSWAFIKNGHWVKSKDFFCMIPEMLHNSYEKRIPPEYLYGDVSQRLSLIQGIMDTDGGITYAEGRFNIRYTSVNRPLLTDVLNVLYSLGWPASVSEDKRNKYQDGVCYYLSFRVPNNIKEDVFRLSRKKSIASKAKATDKLKKYDRLAIHSIDDLGYKCDMVCIYVDNAEHLYLTNDYIVTHNTLIATATANLLYQYGRCDGIVYIASPTQEQKQGYLKGTIEEKSEPYFEPFYEALEKIGVNYNVAFYDGAINEKYQTAYIQCVTHTFLRGTNFENKVVIIDEAQNYYFDELKKVLTRLHDSCKILVIGHEGQNDLFDHPERSGFVPYLRWFAGDDRTAICRLVENHRGWISQHADELTFRAAMKILED